MWTSDLAKKAGPPLSHLGRRERGKGPTWIIVQGAVLAQQHCSPLCFHCLFCLPQMLCKIKAEGHILTPFNPEKEVKTNQASTLTVHLPKSF